MLPNVLVVALSQVAAPQQPPAMPLVVDLVPAEPAAAGGPRWSPKGASVPLEATNGELHGKFALGSPGGAAVRVVLRKGEGAERFDRLWIDLDRDGKQADAELLATTPKEQRGKWWSSFAADVPVATSAGGLRPYPLSLWFVEDPQEPGAAPALRWSRRGWHAGELQIGGRPAYVYVTEMVMDGVFDQRDAWAIARSPKELSTAKAPAMESHVWLDGVAYRALSIDADGSKLSFEAFDPGFTEAEEKDRLDTTKPDREAARAAAPLPFGKDLAAALAEANRTGQKVFVDFETTWCGPCKVMDQWVYTAAEVVDAAKPLLAVKLDGDEQRDLVKKYEVGGYPTMLLLDADGKVLRRAVGYRSVKAMAAWLRGD
ncbi:MAG: hypothetical protein RL398_198 [Planctomycetota bacterium]|jgi:thiol-disulfide isomerase/thioredoxin